MTAGASEARCLDLKLELADYSIGQLKARNRNMNKEKRIREMK